MAGELESSFSTKDKTEDDTPSTKISKNVLEQPTSTDENSASLSNKKKAKLETSNGNTSRSRPSIKLTEGNAVETPSSVIGDQLKDMPNETLCKEGTPRTGGTGATTVSEISSFRVPLFIFSPSDLSHFLLCFLLDILIHSYLIMKNIIHSYLMM